MGICSQTGMTAVGKRVKTAAMTTPKTAITMRTVRKTTQKKISRTRVLMNDAAISERLCPRFRSETTREPRSWTAPIRIEPKTIQRTAGTQPQITPMAGPTMGPVPAIEVK